MFREKKVFVLALVSLFLFFFVSKPVHAFEISSDPQYVVINFVGFYGYDWTASEEAWVKTVKPKIKTELRKFKTQLTVGTPQRRLAWSTLNEYTDFPLDVPSEKSPYVIRARRIMEVAEEENLPVFMPLNGVQWWNELPELWNYWDPDGEHTPGCKNEEYTQIDGYINNQPIYRCKFEKLRDPSYRKRFIKGYNPANKWNVEWSDWETPMQFNTRNWGGGDIDVAPPANIVDQNRAPISFKKVQTQRYEAIVRTIAKKLADWEKTGKQDLFAGITIGTEVTLNASILPGDENFKPFGYRAIQDSFCPKDKPTCGTEASWSAEMLETKREKVLNTYFNDLAQRAFLAGIPKQRIYSHVWSEADKGERKYTNAIGASVTLYSRPGLSIYGKALDPLGFRLLRSTLEESGYPAWAAPEFAPLTRDASNWNTALSATLDSSIDAAKVIDIYNENDIAGTAAIPQLRAVLQLPARTTSCVVSEVLPKTKNNVLNPSVLNWSNLVASDEGSLNEVYISSKLPLSLADMNKLPVASDSAFVKVPGSLKDGKYYWLVKRTGCSNATWTTSTPHYFVKKYIPPPPPSLWERILGLLGIKPKKQK